MPATSRPPHRRPALLDPSSMADFGADRLDPAVITQVAHETAAILVHTGRARQDPQTVDRLVTLVDDVGLDTLAELWAQRPARSLPGALWRLYVLREWVRRDPAGASADYAAGERFADHAVVVAGAGSPPGPAELRALADAILRGVFEGDFAVALHRASAFCRVVSAGRASRGDALAELVAHPSAAIVSTVAGGAAAVLTMAEDLEASARKWERDDLT